MKNIGIVRKLDPLHRIVIPQEITETMQFEERQPLEIFVEGENIILRKYRRGCVFCGENTEETFKEKNVCEKCRREAMNDAT